MKNNLRSKIQDFLTSEEGRVGVKAPLTLGIVSGSVLLAQAMLPPAAQAHMECSHHGDCDDGESCWEWCEGEWVGDDTCDGVRHSACH